jgi:SAM-dependent methyltransferase
MTSHDTSKYVPALGWHWLTPYYDAVVGTTTREGTFKRALIEQASVTNSQRVLDLACGTGTLSIWIKERHPEAEVVGVDGDPAILSLARRKAARAGSSVRFDEAMSYALPYPDDHFDRVLSSLFFHHLSWADKERTAREVYRVLRPGGQLHVADWGRSTNALMRGLFVFIQLLDGIENTQPNVTGKLPTLFRAAGFIDVRQTATFSTMFGTMALYTAAKPGDA